MDTLCIVGRSSGILVHSSLVHTISDVPTRVFRGEGISENNNCRANDPDGGLPAQIVGHVCGHLPGFESPIHRTLFVYLDVVSEGEFEFITDLGGRRFLEPGNLVVQSTTMHGWKIGTPVDKWTRMFYVLIAVEMKKTIGGAFVDKDLVIIPRL